MVRYFWEGESMKNLFRFIHHIINVCAASGKKRLGYSFLHILSLAMMAACFYGVYFMVTGADSVLAGAGLGGLVLSRIGIVICAAMGVLFFLQGFVAQIVTFITGLIGLAKAEERAANLAAALVALLSVVALIVAGVLLFA